MPMSIQLPPVLLHGFKFQSVSPDSCLWPMIQLSQDSSRVRVEHPAH